MMKKLVVLCGVLAGLASQYTWAVEQPHSKYCDDRPHLGWNFYCDEPPAEEAPPEAAPMTAPAPTPAPPTDPLEITKKFREDLDRAKSAALIDPTPEKVQAYIAMQRLALDQSSKFTEVWQRVLWQNPDMDYLLERPVGTIAKQTYLDERQAAEVHSLGDLKDKYGVFFIYESSCVYCQRYSPILKGWAKRYGIDVLPITADGIALPEWPESVPDRGQILQMGLEGKPFPMTVLFDVKNRQAIPIGYGLLSDQELTEHVYLLTKVEAGNDL